MWDADLLRVGPLRRLDKRLLPHSLHCSQVTKGPSEAVAELQAMLQEAAMAPADIAAIQAELDQVPLQHVVDMGSYHLCPCACNLITNISQFAGDEPEARLHLHADVGSCCVCC